MRDFWKKARTYAGLSVLFLVVYGTCSVITGLRAGVGSLNFSWERAIPFLPALILPYMSIDLFFIAGPFITRTDRERIMLAKRISAAILIAGGCFLLFPLRLAFERPPLDGVLGVIFNNFRTLDGTFNQCPSLHIALCLILFDLYFRHTTELVRFGLVLWFALIGVSPLVTYQHQVVDIVGGFILGVFCLHFFQEAPLRMRFWVNHRIAGYYAGAGAFLAFISYGGRPWAYVLLWPAFSLLIVAAGYGFLGPGIFRKNKGRLEWTTWVLLGPVLVGQWVSKMYYARECQPYDRVTDHLWIGRHLSDPEARNLLGSGVTAVLDLASEFSEPAAFREVPYLNLPILDLTPPTFDQLDAAVAFIRRHAESGIVYVHCKIGYSRTAAIVGAYLMASGQAGGVEEAVEMLRRARPSIIVRPEALAALRGIHPPLRPSALLNMGNCAG